MISNCLFANGRVHLPNTISDNEMIAKHSNPARQYTTEFIEFEKKHEGYWTGEHLVKQITNVVILMVKLLYPTNKYQGIFLFDNVGSHAPFMDDALWASEMNKEPGGKHPKIMRDGYYQTTIYGIIESQIQQMCFTPSMSNSLENQPKGLQI